MAQEEEECRKKYTQQEQLISNELFFISASYSYVRIGSWTNSAVALKMPMPLGKRAVQDYVHKIEGWGEVVKTWTRNAF